ncbi:hypothetical protein [Pseudomonas sp. MWU12-2037]|uniref:hypothetical protein n=1 Tax=Pseudomonas sp. MWU12-2037 TaxID=2928690 RepID=UPI00200BA7FC|nr:hypothetical protein [Pseudomonas sp. MWU12-2037]
MTSIMLDFKEAAPACCNGAGVQSQGHSRRRGGWVLAAAIALCVIAPLISAPSYAQPVCGPTTRTACRGPVPLFSSRKPANNSIINQSQTNITIINNFYVSNAGNNYNYTNNANYVPAQYSQSTFPSYNGGVGRYPIY